ncbi:hypothetical protein V2W30_41065 (plasmid) [Streptomyces sp. Q6]|uniref:Uncharacterized protein n=1 Tax=Streptomyces citrinus TaxID=3118173 RepID=A0ACD5AQU0_9ACTN
MNERLTDASRHTRFGVLPERVRFEDRTEEVETDQGPIGVAYIPEGPWKYYPCLALDMGL